MDTTGRDHPRDVLRLDERRFSYASFAEPPEAKPGWFETTMAGIKGAQKDGKEEEQKGSRQEENDSLH